MPDYIQINLRVMPGKKQYPLVIDSKDEEIVRAATMQLRQKITSYRETYKNEIVSDLDIITMVAIEIATSHLRLEGKNDIVPVNNKIQQLDNELKDYLKKTY
jgi:cell division protein ZapA